MTGRIEYDSGEHDDIWSGDTRIVELPAGTDYNGEEIDGDSYTKLQVKVFGRNAESGFSVSLPPEETDSMKHWSYNELKRGGVFGGYRVGGRTLKIEGGEIIPK